MSQEKKAESKKNERDKRTHHQRLLDLREAFGICKEKALRADKINECSITKVADRANVAKLYLTGNKEFAQKGIAEKYRAIGKSILEFRELFQNGKLALQEDNRVQALEDELRTVKFSVYRYFLDLQSARHASEIDGKKLKQAENDVLLLQAQLADGLTKRAQVNALSDDALSISNRLKRTIISPDQYLFVDGQYNYHDEELRHQAWIKSYDELEAGR